MEESCGRSASHVYKSYWVVLPCQIFSANLVFVTHAKYFNAIKIETPLLPP